MLWADPREHPHSAQSPATWGKGCCAWKQRHSSLGWGGGRVCRCPAAPPPPRRAVPLKGVPEPEEVLVGGTPKQTPDPEPPRRAGHGKAGSEATAGRRAPDRARAYELPQPGTSSSACPEPRDAASDGEAPCSPEMRVWRVNAEAFSPFALFLEASRDKRPPAARLPPCSAVAPGARPLPDPPRLARAELELGPACCTPRGAPLSWPFWRQTHRSSPLKGPARTQARQPGSPDGMLCHFLRNHFRERSEERESHAQTPELQTQPG